MEIAIRPNKTVSKIAGPVTVYSCSRIPQCMMATAQMMKKKMGAQTKMRLRMKRYPTKKRLMNRYIFRNWQNIYSGRGIDPTNTRGSAISLLVYSHLTQSTAFIELQTAPSLLCSWLWSFCKQVLNYQILHVPCLMKI